MYSKKKFLWFIAILLIVIISCKNDDSFEDDDNTPTGSTSSINEINNALKFNSSQFINGDAPANSNSGDLKINKDTINIWPGIKSRISILNHTNISITGVLVHMPNADGYHDVAIETEESNDTLTVFYVDIDSDGLSLPFNNTIIISPTDGSGNVIDEFDPVIHTDTPYDPTNTDYTPSGLTCTPAFDKNLHWSYTKLNNAFSDAPNFPAIKSDYTVDGCCQNGVSYSTCHPAPENASVDVTEQYARTDLEFIKFFDDGGDFAYQLFKTFNDYWAPDTDFCSRSPGYKFRQPKIFTIGKFSVDQSASSDDYAQIVINSIDFDTNDYLTYGFGPILKVNENNPDIKYLLGCRYYIETILVEGLDILRVFENVKDFDLWYD